MFRSHIFICLFTQASLALTLLSATAPYASAQPSNSPTELLDRFGDWTVYRNNSANDKLCFVASTPKDSVPKGVNRGKVYFYVTNWPKHKVREEVSVKMGYPFRSGTQPTVTIGPKTFALYVRGDKAFIQDQLEPQLVKAMRLGQKMVVRGISERGTSTQDVYSLSGVSRALKQAQIVCK